MPQSPTSNTGGDQKFGRVEGVPGDEPCFILRAKDRCAIEAMLAYVLACQRAGSPNSHSDQVLQQVVRFSRWQEDHPDRCKVPD